MVYSPLGIYLMNMPYHLRQAIMLLLLEGDKDVRGNHEAVCRLVKHLYKLIHGGYQPCCRNAHLALLGRHHLIQEYPFLHGLLEVKMTQFNEEGRVEYYRGCYPSYHVKELISHISEMVLEAKASSTPVIMRDYLTAHVPPEKEFCDEPIKKEEHDAYYQEGS